jgi:general secretion pathway protein D
MRLRAWRRNLPLGKTFGLFACATVVAASVWWASSQQTGQAVLAQIEPGSGVTGPPGFGAPPSAGDEQLQAAQRARINDFMRRAVQMERQGNKNAAIRFAASADALVKTSRVALNPDAESPAQFITRLQGRSAGPQGPTPQAAAGNPFAAAPVERNSRPTPTVPGSDSPAKREAKELLGEARRAFDAGDVDSARTLALEAQKLGAAWTLFEDDPSKVLADIERTTNTTTFSGSPFPSESPESQAIVGNPFAGPSPAAEKPNPFESAPRSEAGPKPPLGNPFAAGQPRQNPAPREPSQNDLNKAEASKLMAAAKQDAAAGRFQEARQKLQNAEALNVIYTVSDERPELVQEDVDRLEMQAGHLAQITPRGAAQPAPVDEAKREQAQKLLEQARADIRGGQFQAAEEKIEKARRLNAHYHQLDDTPELVAEWLKRFQPSVVDPEAIPDFPGFPPASNPVVKSEPAVSPAPSFPPVPNSLPKPEPVSPVQSVEAGNEGNPFATVPLVEAPVIQPAPPKPEGHGTFDIAKNAPAPAPAPANTDAGGVHPS